MISLVVGLGNPGEKYPETRHNLGFNVIHNILNAEKLKLKTAELYDWTEKLSNSSKIIFALPKTYMNLSGLAVSALLQKYQIEPTQMLVVADDFNLPLGSVRIRKSGSDGGHNGLASLIYELESENFPRLRLGIGPVPENTDKADFVLEKFTPEEKKLVEKMIKTASDAVLFSFEQTLDEVMTKYNINPA